MCFTSLWNFQKKSENFHLNFLIKFDFYCFAMLKRWNEFKDWRKNGCDFLLAWWICLCVGREIFSFGTFLFSFSPTHSQNTVFDEFYNYFFSYFFIFILFYVFLFLVIILFIVEMKFLLKKLLFTFFSECFTQKKN